MFPFNFCCILIHVLISRLLKRIDAFAATAVQSRLPTAPPSIPAAVFNQPPPPPPSTPYPGPATSAVTATTQCKYSLHVLIDCECIHYYEAVWLQAAVLFYRAPVRWLRGLARRPADSVAWPGQAWVAGRGRPAEIAVIHSHSSECSP